MSNDQYVSNDHPPGRPPHQRLDPRSSATFWDIWVFGAEGAEEKIIENPLLANQRQNFLACPELRGPKKPKKPLKAPKNTPWAPNCMENPAYRALCGV